MKIFSRFPTWRRQTSVLLAVFAFVAVPGVAYLAAIAWTNNVIDAGFTSAMMFAVDLDGDTDIDIVGIGRTPDDVAWYENDGSENFTKNTIDSNAPGVRDVEVGDIDNDGDIDIVISQVDSTPDGVYWYDNDGSESFTKRTISTLDNPIYIDLADVNEDGELDVLASAWSLGHLVYYQNLGGTPSTFSTTLIDNNMTTPTDVEAGDIDGDGDIDIIMTHASTYFQFYENDGSETFTETTFASTTLANASSYGLHIEDIDADGDLDMVVAGAAGIHLYLSSGADNPTFTRSEVYDSAQSDIDVADLDGDGDKDIVGSYETTNSLIRWFENDGSEVFTTATVDSSVTYPWKVDAADIDGDGDQDILVGSNNGVEWWQNGGAPSTSSASNGGRAAHQRRKKMIQQMRAGIFTYEDTEAPSLASVGIFDPAEQQRVHAAAVGSGTTVEDEDNDDDDSQARSDMPTLLVQTGRGTEELARIERLHNRHTQKTQVVAFEEIEDMVEENVLEFEYQSSLHQRVCERVQRRFGDNEKMMDRINSRLEKTFGWQCE